MIKKLNGMVYEMISKKIPAPKSPCASGAAMMGMATASPRVFWVSALLVSIPFFFGRDQRIPFGWIDTIQITNGTN
jgi:hypothetical protein